MPTSTNNDDPQPNRRHIPLNRIGDIIALIIAGSFVAAGLTDTSKPATEPSELRVAQKTLRDVLKDPAKTDQLINRLERYALTQEFLDDPEVITNLKRLLAAVEGHFRESFGDRVKRLQDKKELLDGTTPDAWAEKAMKRTGEPTPKRRSG
jgi:hypothetical protein